MRGPLPAKCCARCEYYTAPPEDSRIVRQGICVQDEVEEVRETYCCKDFIERDYYVS